MRHHHPDEGTSGLMRLRCLTTRTKTTTISCLSSLVTILLFLASSDLVSCVPQFQFTPNNHRNVRAPVPVSFVPRQGNAFTNPADALSARSQFLQNRSPAPLNPWQQDDHFSRSPLQSSASSTSSFASNGHRQSGQQGSNCGYGVSL